ncbi:hypothetical protein PsAD37_03424 [Pseudovibrio sp. Ad37]|nr:hypothetical protein PsAD37_03424 [Pseudovibrio sp. Ad37]
MLRDKINAFGLGIALHLQAFNLLLQLSNLLAKLFLAAFDALLTGSKESLLTIQSSGSNLVGLCQLNQNFREGDLSVIAPFGRKAGFLSLHLVKTLAGDGQIGFHHGLIKAEQHITGFDLIAIFDKDFANNAAFLMLHFLGLPIDSDGAGGDHSAVDLGNGGPAAKAEHKNAHKDEAPAHVFLTRGLNGGKCCLLRHVAPRSMVLFLQQLVLVVRRGLEPHRVLAHQQGR